MLWTPTVPLPHSMCWLAEPQQGGEVLGCTLITSSLGTRVYGVAFEHREVSVPA